MSSLLLASTSTGVLATVAYMSQIDQVRHLRALDRAVSVSDLAYRSALSAYRDRCIAVQGDGDWDRWADAHATLDAAARDYAVQAGLYNATLDGSFLALTLGRRLGLRRRSTRLPG